MKWLTTIFEWAETRLDKGAWFRRVYVIVATVLTWKTVQWSFGYAEGHCALKSGQDIALVIGAVSLIVGAINGFAFKQYLESKGG